LIGKEIKNEMVENVEDLIPNLDWKGNKE